MTPIDGLVVAVNEDAVTIRLETGLEKQVINYTKLCYGDLVHVIYDYTKGRIKKAWLKGTFLTDELPGPIEEEKVEGGDTSDYGEEGMFASLSLSSP
jgi:hypothetical protein